MRVVRGIFILVSIACCPTAALEQAIHQNREQSIIQRADELVKSGNSAEAAALLQSFLAEHPTASSDAREFLTLIFIKERRYSDAAAMLRSVKPFPAIGSRTRYLRLLASIQSGLGHAKDAATTMENALLLAPHDATLRLATAVAQADAGKWQKCLQTVAPLSRSRRPSADVALLILKSQLATKADFATTLRVLQELGDTAEQKIAIRLRAGRELAEFGKHNEAAQLFQDVVTTSGPEKDLLFDLAIEQYRGGHFDAALATLSALRELGPSAEAEDLAGDIAELQGDFVRAIHAYQAAVSIAPNEERYRLALGAELIRHESYEPAALVFEQAATLFPTSPRIYLGLGMAQYFLEKYDESVSSFFRADELSKGSGEALAYLGQTQLRRTEGPLRSVLDRICRRADANPADATARVWCSSLRFRQAYISGKQAAAPEIVRQLRLANQVAPGDPTAACALGTALSWTAEWADARVWLERCVRLQPDSIEAHFRLTRVYNELGLADLAQSEIEATRRARAHQEQREKFSTKFIYKIEQPNQPNTHE